MLKTVLRTGIFCAFLAAAPAFASTIVWQDPVHGFTMSYPDSWTVQTDDTANTRIRVAGPLGEDLPACRMKVMEDGRSKIYPKTYVDEDVVKKLNEDFWQGEIAQYEDAKILEYFAPAGLGNKGDATAVRVTYRQSDGQKMVPMQGVMIGSIYGDKRYLASCASKQEAYGRWAELFMSILDSVELETRYHPFATGYYRNFLMDPKLNLPRSKPGTTKEDQDLGFFKRFFTDKYHK